MSSNLIWEPAHRKKANLSDELKYVLRKRHGEPVDVVMKEGDLFYLKGLLDAGIKDTQKLIDAIERYHEISVREE